MELGLKELNDCTTQNELVDYIIAQGKPEILGDGYTRTCVKVNIPELSKDAMCMKIANNLTGVYSNIVECNHFKKGLSFMPKLFTASDLGLFIAVELGDPLDKHGLAEAEEFFADSRRYFKDNLSLDEENLIAFLREALQHSWDEVAKEFPKYDNVALSVRYAMDETNNIRRTDFIRPDNLAFFTDGSTRVVKPIDFGNTAHRDYDAFSRLSFSLLM